MVAFSQPTDLDSVLLATHLYSLHNEVKHPLVENATNFYVKVDIHPISLIFLFMDYEWPFLNFCVPTFHCYGNDVSGQFLLDFLTIRNVACDDHSNFKLGQHDGNKKTILMIYHKTPFYLQLLSRIHSGLRDAVRAKLCHWCCRNIFSVFF